MLDPRSSLGPTHKDVLGPLGALESLAGHFYESEEEKKARLIREGKTDLALSAINDELAAREHIGSKDRAAADVAREAGPIQEDLANSFVRSKVNSYEAGFNDAKRSVIDTAGALERADIHNKNLMAKEEDAAVGAAIRSQSAIEDRIAALGEESEKAITKNATINGVLDGNIVAQHEGALKLFDGFTNVLRPTDDTDITLGLTKAKQEYQKDGDVTKLLGSVALAKESLKLDRKKQLERAQLASPGNIQLSSAGVDPNDIVKYDKEGVTAQGKMLIAETMDLSPHMASLSIKDQWSVANAFGTTRAIYNNLSSERQLERLDLINKGLNTAGKDGAELLAEAGFAISKTDEFEGMRPTVKLMLDQYVANERAMLSQKLRDADNRKSDLVETGAITKEQLRNINKYPSLHADGKAAIDDAGTVRTNILGKAMKYKNGIITADNGRSFDPVKDVEDAGTLIELFLPPNERNDPNLLNFNTIASLEKENLNMVKVIRENAKTKKEIELYKSLNKNLLDNLYEKGGWLDSLFGKSEPLTQGQAEVIKARHNRLKAIATGMVLDNKDRSLILKDYKKKLDAIDDARKFYRNSEGNRIYYGDGPELTKRRKANFKKWARTGKDDKIIDELKKIIKEKK